MYDSIRCFVLANRHWIVRVSIVIAVYSAGSHHLLYLLAKELVRQAAK